MSDLWIVWIDRNYYLINNNKNTTINETSELKLKSQYIYIYEKSP